MPLSPYNPHDNGPAISYKLALGLGLVGVLGGGAFGLRGDFHQAVMLAGLGLALCGWGIFMHPRWSNPLLLRLSLVVALAGGIAAWLSAVLLYL